MLWWPVIERFDIFHVAEIYFLFWTLQIIKPLWGYMQKLRNLLHVLPGRMWEMGSSNTHIKSCRDKVDSITNYSHTAGSAVKTPPADAGDLGLISRVVKIPWTRKWQPAPVFMPGKSHGQRSLVGYGPRGCKRIRHKLVTKYQNQGSLSPIIPSFWALLNMI